MNLYAELSIFYPRKASWWALVGWLVLSLVICAVFVLCIVLTSRMFIDGYERIPWYFLYTIVVPFGLYCLAVALLAFVSCFVRAYVCFAEMFRRLTGVRMPWADD